MSSEHSPQLHKFRFPVGQAYLWQEGADLTLIDAGDIDAAPAIEGAGRGLGLDPGRIGRIVITHGHCDHYGAAQESWPTGPVPRSSPLAWTPR
jgi:glyoxylase-like metal-dependent hydrolase (beta-lactamase superfamily II)